MNRKSLLIDITKCVGCGACAVACGEANNLPSVESKELDATHYTVVTQHGELYVRRLCMHCNEPTCVSVCPVGAFTKKDTSAVLYDETKCIGCRYCMQACPFQIPKYEWGNLIPRVQKCKFCYERVSAGQQTACAEACLFGATTFGNRDELIVEARKRIRDNPNDYLDYIYGLEEVGGTSVLYISKVDFASLGLPTNLPKESIPKLSWNILSQIPKYVVASSIVLYGIHWITSRRKEVKKFEERVTNES